MAGKMVNGKSGLALRCLARVIHSNKVEELRALSEKHILIKGVISTSIKYLVMQYPSLIASHLIDRGM